MALTLTLISAARRPLHRLSSVSVFVCFLLHPDTWDGKSLRLNNIEPFYISMQLGQCHETFFLRWTAEVARGLATLLYFHS